MTRRAKEDQLHAKKSVIHFANNFLGRSLFVKRDSQTRDCIKRGLTVPCAVVCPVVHSTNLTPRNKFFFIRVGLTSTYFETSNVEKLKKPTMLKTPQYARCESRGHRGGHANGNEKVLAGGGGGISRAFVLAAWVMFTEDARHHDILQHTFIP